MAGSPHFRHEKTLTKAGQWPVAGVDEVGRGPLAGPVVAAAVILDPARLPKGVNDSKQLSAADREAMFEEIMRKALAVSVASCTPVEIDLLNIRGATLTAMTRAVRGLALAPLHVLVDGKDVPLGLVGTALVGGDAISTSIASASIVAKVTRDRLMKRVALEHPGYGFESHVGYATEIHRAAIERLGPCPHHRMSFAPLKQKALLIA